MQTLRFAILTLSLVQTLAGCSSDSFAPNDIDTSPSASAPRAPSTIEWASHCATEAPDRAELSALFASERYVELEAAMARIYEDYWSNTACEARVWEISEMLQSNSHEKLDAWVAERPDGWVPRSIRGGHRVTDGYKKRGNKFSKDVTEEQWAGMREDFAVARSDFEQALALEPRAIFATGRLIVMLRGSGNKNKIDQALESALEHNPANYGVRRRAIESLSPSWGGSLEAIESVAEQAQNQIEQNPRLRVLSGFSHGMQGQRARIDKDYETAIAHYKTALSYGGFPDWYRSLCWLLNKKEDHRGVIRTAKSWLEYRPDLPEALRYRGSAYGSIHGSRALGDLDRAIELAPRYTFAYQTRYWVRERKGDLEGAVGDLRTAHELDPRDMWTLRQLARVLDERLGRAEEAEPVYRNLVASDADRAHAWFRLGSLLHDRNDPEAKPVLAEYLRIARSDPDESGRVSRARQMLNPSAASQVQTLPGLSRVAMPADS